MSMLSCRDIPAMHRRVAFAEVHLPERGLCWSGAVRQDPRLDALASAPGYFGNALAQRFALQ
jgi:hypothetical protein